MKVVCVDNFARETVSDKLICENVNPFYAKWIAELLNDKFSGDESSRFYKAVNDDYKLYEFEP